MEAWKALVYDASRSAEIISMRLYRLHRGLTGHILELVSTRKA